MATAFKDYYATLGVPPRGQRGLRGALGPGEAAPLRRGRPARWCEGETEISLEEAYTGTSRVVDLGDRRVEVRIPERITDEVRAAAEQLRRARQAAERG